MLNRVWQNCNDKCGFYKRDDDKCGLKLYHLAPSLKCLLVMICYLLRGFELDRDKETENEDWWKEGGN